MNTEHFLSKSGFLASAVLINAVILLIIPQLDLQNPFQKYRADYTPIWLTDHEPLKPKQIKKQVKRPEPPKTIQPEKMPQLKLTQKPKPVVPPKIKMEIPKPKFDISPLLKTGLAVSRPRVEPVKKPKPLPIPVVDPTPTQPAPDPAPAVAAAPAPVQAVPSEFNEGNVDKVPRIIRKVEPVYPYRARRRNIRGNVVVKFLVSPDGRVQKPTIVKSTPQGVFEKSVLKALASWRFTPGYFRGKPVPTWVMLPIRFNLNG